MLTQCPRRFSYDSWLSLKSWDMPARNDFLFQRGKEKKWGQGESDSQNASHFLAKVTSLIAGNTIQIRGTLQGHQSGGVKPDYFFVFHFWSDVRRGLDTAYPPTHLFFLSQRFTRLQPRNAWKKTNSWRLGKEMLVGVCVCEHTHTKGRREAPRGGKKWTFCPLRESAC